MTNGELLNSYDFDLIKKIIYCDIHKCDFVDFNSGDILLTYKDAIELQSFYKNTKVYKKTLNFIHAKNKRYNNLINRIIFYLNIGSCCFFTLTFNDETLNKTTELTRRKYVRRFLKSLSNFYIANIDFGLENNREHYHGVIVLDDLSLISNWSYGFSNAQFIRDKRTDVNRISNYILKIANHFVKETTKNNYCIYSRDIVNWGANKKIIVKNKNNIYEQISLLYKFDNFLYK